MLFSPILSRSFRLFGLLAGNPEAIRYFPDSEGQSMWDHIMSMTNNPSGMCCEEIEEFVMGRENWTCGRKLTDCSTCLCSEIESSHARAFIYESRHSLFSNIHRLCALCSFIHTSTCVRWLEQLCGFTVWQPQFKITRSFYFNGRMQQNEKELCHTGKRKQKALINKES